MGIDQVLVIPTMVIMFLPFAENEEGVEAFCQAYNDFLVDWCSADPRRLIPVMSTPFWDVDAAVAEIERAVAKGHRGVNFCNQPEHYGVPPLAHPHWDPVWAAAQDAGVPISFHIGGGDIGRKISEGADFMGVQPAFARFSALLTASSVASTICATSFE